MEGVSIAKAAVLNGLSFVEVRAISDKADGSAEMDYPMFEDQAAAHCPNMVLEMVLTVQRREDGDKLKFLLKSK